MTNAEIRTESNRFITENRLSGNIWKTILWVIAIEILMSFILGFLEIPIRFIPVIGVILGYVISIAQSLFCDVIGCGILRHCLLLRNDCADTPSNDAFYYMSGGTGSMFAFITDSTVRSTTLRYILQFLIADIFTKLIPGVLSTLGALCFTAYAASSWFGASALKIVFLVIGVPLIVAGVFLGLYFNLKLAAVQFLVASEDEPVDLCKKSSRIMSKHLWSYFCVTLPYFLWCFMPIAGPIITLLQLPKISMTNAIFLSQLFEEWDGEY